MYGNSVKSNWRNLVWETASRHVTDLSLPAVTLAGKRFLDRKIAKRFGFSDVIGIDIDDSVVEHNNKFKRTIINLDLSEFCSTYGKKVSFINADYCSNGVSKEIPVLLRAAMFNQRLGHPLIALTVSVGRENKVFMNSVRSADKKIMRGVDLQNRALVATDHWVEMAVLLQKMLVLETMGLDQDQASEAAVMDEDAFQIEFDTYWTNSYVAHKMRMDTVLFKVSVGNVDQKWLNVDCTDDQQSKAHVAAKLAWRTMRNEH